MMVKIMDEFRKGCLDLLPLMEERHDYNPSDFSNLKVKGDKIVYREKSYYKIIRTLVNNLLDRNPLLNQNYSTKYLINKIDNFIIDLFFDSDPVKVTKIDVFYKSLIVLPSQIKSFKTIRFIENLEIENEISIGLVSFSKYTPAIFESILKSLNASEEHLKFILTGHDDENVSSISIVEVSAIDTDKIVEKSDNLIEESLNVIRLYGPHSNIGMKGTLVSQKTSAIFYSLDDKIPLVKLERKEDFSKAILNIDELNNLKNEQSFVNINQILQKMSNSTKMEDMEKNLIHAINWYGNIVKNKNDSENVYRLFTTLEILLLNDTEEKRKNLGERVSLINYSLKNNRINCNNFITTLYAERNNIVHDG